MAARLMVGVGAVIKSGEPGNTTVRAFEGLRAALRDIVVPMDPLVAERDGLRDEVARLERRIASLTREADDAIASAREAGHAAGCDAAERHEHKRVAALAAALTAGRDVFDLRLDALDGLAAALARRALDGVFDSPDAMAALVAATIARHMTLLRAQAAVGIAVSAADFPTPDMLASLGDGAIAVAIGDDLAAGQCRVTCRLGEIDLDVPGQGRRIADLLDALADAA